MSCKKNKFIEDPSAKLQFSQDSILFDTVFTTIGSSTRNFRIRNTHNEKIKISSIFLEGGTSSPFKINVDGTPGTSFSDLEIAPNDSMYVFVQVNVNPTNQNSPLIISDALHFLVNGNEQKMPLEAWGQDAYYHRPEDAVKFQDGSYFPYSLANAVPNSYNLVGDEFVWKNDKPHVVYGYLVVDGPDSLKNTPGQKLKIIEGTKVYLNYKAGIWVYPGGQIQVLGKKGKEVVFQGARREKEYSDEPGQWDRIWINEGSNDNIIDFAIIKNAFIGLQTEIISDDVELLRKRQLTLTNTKIQNMSMWGLYSRAYVILAGNNVISNCQEYSVNIELGGLYRFYHNTFANYWTKGKAREKTTVRLNNYNELQVAPMDFHMGNSIVDGKLENELTIDLKDDAVYQPTCTISNSWLKTNINTSDPAKFINNRIGTKDDVLKYKDVITYDFEPAADETRIKDFIHPRASADVKIFPTDINEKLRSQSKVTAGAYEIP